MHLGKGAGNELKKNMYGINKRVSTVALRACWKEGDDAEEVGR